MCLRLFVRRTSSIFPLTRSYMPNKFYFTSFRNNFNQYWMVNNFFLWKSYTYSETSRSEHIWFINILAGFKGIMLDAWFRNFWMTLWVSSAGPETKHILSKFQVVKVGQNIILFIQFLARNISNLKNRISPLINKSIQYFRRMSALKWKWWQRYHRNLNHGRMM